MSKALRVCSKSGCPNTTPTAGRCSTCQAEADKARGTAAQRGYSNAAHLRFRHRVLLRDPVCVLCNVAQSTVADHWPDSRRDLVDQGLDPNETHRGRGLCKQCHDQQTAQHQPGGWNRP